MGPRSIFQRISASIGVFSNILLIILIVKKSPKTLGSYKILMIYISIFEILYSILDALTVPKMFGEGSGAFIFVFANQALLPNNLLLYADVLYCTFFGTSMAVFSVHFIYRYLAVSGSGIIKNHIRKVVFFLLLFPIVFGSLWFILSYYTIGPYEGADLFIKKYYIVDHDVELSEMYYVGYHFYPEDFFGNTYINWRGVIGCSIQAFFISVSFSLIFIFGIKCHRYTKSVTMKSVNSTAQMTLQNQLFYALVFQTVIPVLLMHLPSTIGIFVCFLSQSKEFMGHILSCTIALYPALDPIPNFFIIKSYRIAIIGAARNFRDFLMCRKTVASNVIFVQSRSNIMMSTTSRI